MDTLRLAILTNLNIAQGGRWCVRPWPYGSGPWPSGCRASPLAATYVDHQGAIQNTTGPISNVNRDSLFVGGGPTITLGLTDALFGPGIARLVLAGQRCRAEARYQ